MKLHRNEIAACVCIVCGIALAVGASVVLPQGKAAFATAAPTATPVPAPAEPTPEPTATPEPLPIVETVHFSATGDDLIHEGLYNQAAARATDGGYDFDFAYANLKDFYSGFDVNWINQETLLADDYEPSGYPCFATPTDIFKSLYNVGFRVFSIANNHSYDKGAGGIASTLRFWDSIPEDAVYTGLYNLQSYDNFSYQTVNGVTIGYLSYTELTNGIPTPADSDYGIVYLNQSDVIEQQIAQVRPNCDVLIISCHYGIEGYHGVTDGQRDYAQWFADRGADLIIGTHPHVTETAEWLTGANGNSAFVVYSLGNFISAQSDADNMIGTILDVTFEKTTQPDGSTSVQVLNPTLHPVITQYENGYSDIRVYLYKDYTDELGAAHGNFNLSREYIEGVLNDSIDPQFLTLD